MNKQVRCKGLKDNGQWEEFEASTIKSALPENSGYERVIVLGTGEELTADTLLPRDELTSL